MFATRIAALTALIDRPRSLQQHFRVPGGWIKASTAINVGDTDAPHLVHRTLEALNLQGVVYGLWSYEDVRWILRTGRDLVDNGLFATLRGTKPWCSSTFEK